MSPKRHRDETPWIGWLTSVAAHAAVLLLAAICLRPPLPGQSGPLLVEALLASEPAPLETLTTRGEGVEFHPLPPETVAEETGIDEAIFDVRHLGGGQAGGTGPGRLRNASFQRRSDAGRSSGGGAEYFGTKAYGDRFVYVLDMSQSMEGGSASGGIGSRFDRAEAELLDSVEQLSPDQSFYVILFCRKTRHMFNGQPQISLPQMRRATRRNKDRLKQWLAGIQLGGGTDPREALHVALGMHPSAIFLLSDGEFNGQNRGIRNGLLRGNPSVREVVRKSNLNAAPIHTFAYEDPVNCEQMRQLAKQTGGEYRYIPPRNTGVNRAAPAGKTRAKTAKRPANRPRPETLLRMAQILESDGKSQIALARYRRIVKEFPTTQAAREAQERVQQIAAEESRP